MREMTAQKLRFLLGIWLLITLAAGLMGPFGTYDALGLWARLPYWGLISAVSIALSEYVEGLVLSGRVARRPLPLLGLALGYGLALSGLINLLNLSIFPGWPFWYGWGILLFFVMVVVVLIFGAIWLATPHKGKAVADANPEAAFLQRLKPANRGALLRIESQDHYLLVLTSKGQELILMRLADAMRELAGADGMQVHRSHWVARRAMAGLRRDNGRLWLVLDGGAEVPVSRANHAEIRALGLG